MLWWLKRELYFEKNHTNDTSGSEQGKKKKEKEKEEGAFVQVCCSFEVLTSYVNIVFTLREVLWLNLSSKSITATDCVLIFLAILYIYLFIFLVITCIIIIIITSEQLDPDISPLSGGTILCSQLARMKTGLIEALLRLLWNVSGPWGSGESEFLKRVPVESQVSVRNYKEKKNNSADEANESAGNVRKQDWNTELLHVQTDLWVSFHLSCTCFKVLGRQPVLPKLTSWCCGKC